MRRRSLSMFNLAQCVVTVCAVLFGIYGLMSASERQQNSPRLANTAAETEADEPGVKPGAKIGADLPPAHAKLVPEPEIQAPPVYSPIDEGSGKLSGVVAYSNGKSAGNVGVSLINTEFIQKAPVWDETNPAKTREQYNRYLTEIERRTRKTRTDDAGKFVFENLDEKASYRVTAGSAETGTMQQIGACGTEVSFTFEVPVVLEGQVERDDGGTLGQFTITVEARQERGPWYAISTATFDDKDGHFRIRAAAGKARVRVFASELVQKETCEVDVPAEGGRVELRLTAAAFLAGKVVGTDGSPLAGVLVMVAAPGGNSGEEPGYGYGDEGSESPRRSARDAERAKILRKELDDMSKELKTPAKKSDDKPSKEELAKRAEARAREQEAKKISEEIDRKSSRSRRPGGKGEVYGGKSGYGQGLMAYTDAKGEYKITGITPGTFTTSATMGALNDSREISFVSGENRADFTIDTGCRVQITVKNSKGEAVTQVTAYFMKEDGNYLSATHLPQSTPGVIDMIGLPEGKCSGFVQASGFAVTELQATLFKGLNAFDVVLSDPAKIKGRVSTGSGKIPREVYVRIAAPGSNDRDNKNGAKHKSKFRHIYGEQYMQIDEKGNYQSQELSPGEYELSVSYQGQDTLYSQKVTLAPGEQTHDITLDEICRLSVTVKLSEEISKEHGLSVLLASADQAREPRIQRYAQVNENGVAEFAFIPEGEYYLMAYAQNAAQSYHRVTLRRGANTATLDVGASNSVRITAVAPESQGGKAGVQEGDIIIEYNGKAITSLQSLITEIQAAQNAASVTLIVVRNGSNLSFTLKGGKIGINGEDWHR